MGIPNFILKILILLVLLFIAKQIWETNKMHKADSLANENARNNPKAPIVVKVEEKIEKFASNIGDYFGTGIGQGLRNGY